MRSITILGATGSIGDSTADIIADNPELFQVGCLVGGSNAQKLAQRAQALGAQRAVIADEIQFSTLKQALAGSGIEIAAGRAAVIDSARQASDITVCAMVGAAGIEPAMAAIEAGNTLALANKEALVCAGHIMMERARQKGVTILPLDSEHNALFQVFELENRHQIERVTLTASCGPFRTWDAQAIAAASLADAMKHPNWTMGQKVTIDSASLANKGLEVIEAHHLFALSAERIDVVVHPQSIIHGMVHYADGSVLAQLGMPDMRTPIAAALAWPKRCEAPRVARLDLARLGGLTFEAPDTQRFPMLALAFEAMRQGGMLAAIYNSANEIAVAALVGGRIRFHQIATIVAMTFEAALADSALMRKAQSLDDVLAADALGRRIANDVVSRALP